MTNQRRGNHGTDRDNLQRGRGRNRSYNRGVYYPNRSSSRRGGVSRGVGGSRRGNYRTNTVDSNRGNHNANIEDTYRPRGNGFNNRRGTGRRDAFNHNRQRSDNDDHHRRRHRTTEQSDGGNHNHDDANEIDELRRNITSLQARLEVLQNRRNQTAPTSSNTEFADVTKNIYKWVQLQHHLNNWKNLPKSLAGRLDRLIDDIKPPNCNDMLQNFLKLLAKKFGHDIRNAVDSHLRQQLNETESTAARLNPLDLMRAKEIADRYLRNRLGRLSADQRHAFINSAAELIGIRRDRSASSDVFPAAADVISTTHPVRHSNSPNRTTTPQPTNNPTMEWNVVAGRSPGRKRRASATPEYPSTGNRFGLLHNESDHNGGDDDEDDDVRILTLPPTHTTKQTKKNKTSNNTMSTLSGIDVFTGPKHDWKIDINHDTTCLVIGDSNLRNISKLPPRWQIASLAGCRLEHVTRALSRSSIADHHINLVIQAGINHRDETASDFHLDIDHLLHEARGLEYINRIFYAGISTSNDIRRTTNIDQINDIIASTVGHDGYILPLDSAHVNITPVDRYGIHHTADTADMIINRIYHHVEGKNF